MARNENVVEVVHDLEVREQAEVVDVFSFDDLPDGVDGYVDIPRKGGKVYRIPIQGINLQVYKEIEDRYRAPQPPDMRVFDKSKNRYINIPNLNDQKYKDEVKKLGELQNYEIILAGLRAEVSGPSLDDKLKLLRKKFMMGDLKILLDGIMRLSNIDNEEIEKAKNDFDQSE